MKIHPAANWLPQLPDAEYWELRDDIGTRGLREPILVKDGHVVDGRHRLRACRELGIEPTFLEYDGDGDIIAEILSRNIFRRHLTADQRAMLVAKLRGPQLKAQAKERKIEGGVKKHLLKTTKALHTHMEIAKEARVSQHKARAALHVLDHEPGLVDRVIAGKQRLADAKPKRKPRPKPQRTLQQCVEAKLLRLFQSFPPGQYRAVRKIIHELTTPQ